MQAIIEWLNAYASAIEATTAVIVAVLTFVLAWKAYSSDDTSKKALNVAREQLQREWMIDLHVEIVGNNGPPAVMRVTNLGKGAVMIETLLIRRQSSPEEIKESSIRIPLSSGNVEPVNVQNHLNEFFWCDIRRPTPSEHTGEWREQRELLEISLRSYSAGNRADSSWTKFAAILKVNHFGDSRVDRTEVP